MSIGNILGLTGRSQLAEITQYQGINLMNGLRKWRSAKARLDAGITEIIDINILGDSISEGAFASQTKTDWINLGYVGKIRNLLRTKYGDVGTGIIPTGFPNGLPYIVPVGFTEVTDFGFAEFHFETTTDGHTLTYQFNGTGVRIYLVKGTNVSFTTQIDGGSEVPQTTGTTFNWADILDITGLSQGDHTLVIKKSGGDNQKLYIAGCMPFKGTTGMRVNLTGKYGIKSGQCSHDIPLSYEFINNPILTIIALTANDYGDQTPVATYINNMSRIIDKALLSGDVLVTSVGVSNYADKTIKQSVYIDALKVLALQKNCAFCDIYARWGGLTGVPSTGFVPAEDWVHPNLQGHQDIANAILDILI